jgi:hypothetical protein
MIELKPFERKHLFMFKPGRFDMEIYDRKFQEFMARNEGNGLTAFINGEAMGCIFMTQPVDGCSTVLMFACDEVREKHWLWLGLAFRRGIEIVPKNLGITRLRVEVFHDFAKSRQWVERMGFRETGMNGPRIVYERAA